MWGSHANEAGIFNEFFDRGGGASLGQGKRTGVRGFFGAVNFPSFFFSGDTIYTAGAEVEAYLGPVTVGADATYNWDESCCGTSEFWTARGWADYYLTPNLRVGAAIKYAAWIDSFLSFEYWNATLSAENRFSGTPVSAWVEGRYDWFESCISCDAERWSVVGGFRIFIDAPGTTLHEHDMQVPWEGGILDGRWLNTIPLE